MGGPMGAYDDETLPWLRQEKQLIAEAVRADVPYWGVCLGSQLLAASPPGHHSAVVRAEAFEATLAAHGAQAAGGRIWFGAWSEIWGRQAAQGLLAADAGVDAVFCGSDQIARGVADGLREAGARLPEDVALVGVDNWEALAINCRPPLTTVDLNLERVGRTAGELLLRAIDGHASGGTHVIQPRLVIRESSGPAGRPADR
jgi:LacI family transcriptional regulator